MAGPNVTLSFRKVEIDEENSEENSSEENTQPKEN